MARTERNCKKKKKEIKIRQSRIYSFKKFENDMKNKKGWKRNWKTEWTRKSWNIHQQATNVTKIETISFLSRKLCANKFRKSFALMEMDLKSQKQQFWRTWAQFSNLIRVVWEVDFVEDLRGLVLYGLHFHLVWRVLPLPVPGDNQPISKRVGNQSISVRIASQPISVWIASQPISIWIASQSAFE